MRHSYCILALALAAVAPSTTSASLITQSIGVHFAEHGTSFSSYNKFDPTLGTLTGVTLEFLDGQATTSTFTFQNNNDFQITSTDNISFTFVIGDQSKSVGDSFFDMLPAFGRVEHAVSGGFSGSTTYTTGLSQFIATGPGLLGFRNPDVFSVGPDGGSATAGAGGVSINSIAPLWSVNVTEKITYTYLTPAEAAALAAPEPGGVALVVSGLGAALIRWAWRRRGPARR